MRCDTRQAYIHSVSNYPSKEIQCTNLSCQMYDNYRICTIILPSVRCTINNFKNAQIYGFYLCKVQEVACKVQEVACLHAAYVMFFCHVGVSYKVVSKYSLFLGKLHMVISLFWLCTIVFFQIR